MHEYAPLALTLVAIFAGILMNKSDINSLKADMISRFERSEKELDKQMDSVNTRLLAIEADLRQFFSVAGELRNLCTSPWHSLGG